MSSKSFLKQVAEDYDMDYDDVKYIQDFHPDEFYEKLEEFIKDRREW